MATTPSPQAAQNGLTTDLASADQSAQLNQSLNNPAITLCGAGQNVNQPAVARAFTWYPLSNNADVAQPFSVTGTSMGRILVPLIPVGDGADVVVSLYADNGSGNPNIAAGPLQTVTITKEMINQVTAPAGLADSSTPPMAVSQYNGAYLSNGITNGPYPLPSGGTSSVSALGGLCQSGDYLIMCGGNDNLTGTALASVNTFPYQGLGTLGPAVPQTALPIGLNSPASTVVADSFLVVVGGQKTSTSGPRSNTTYIASWDNNTGTVGSWSQQANLPVASYEGGAASWGNYVYYVQGSTGVAGGTTCPVYYGLVDNGQITTWNTAAGIPSGTSITSPYVAAINGWLIVAGGIDNGSNTLVNAYAAKISATDGSIGGWQNITSLPVANFAFAPGLNTAVMDDILSLVGGVNAGTGSITTVQSITVTPEGPGDIWYLDAVTAPGWAIVGAFPIGNGVYDLFSIDVAAGTGIYNTEVSSVSFVPVPLQATLTASTTYHWVFRMVGGTASDYVQIGLDNGNVGLYGTALTSSARFGTSWSALTNQAVAMWMNDSTMGVVGILRHTIEGTTTLGSGNLTGTMTNRWMTFIYENTISNSNAAPLLPKGFLDVTMAPMVPLNANPTFTSGTSPWTVTNGTITQSSAQTHGGFAFSGLVTPTGGFSQCAAFSERIPVPSAGNWQRNAELQTWVLVSGWFYSPTGTTSNNFTLGVEWRDSGQGFLSFVQVAAPNLAANTWTLVWGYAQAPLSASYMTIQVSQNGSPTSSNLIYMSNPNVTTPPEYTPSMTSVMQMGYSGVWPPTGITQLV